MQIKISYLVAAIDKNRKANDQKYLYLFFTKDNEIPSITVDKFEKNEYDILRQIHESYIKYDFNFYPKILCGFRVLDHDKCEISYLTTIKYMSDSIQNGSLYTLDQIQEKNILLEEYYGELFFKFGQPSIR
jgi:hypothetical protein